MCHITLIVALNKQNQLINPKSENIKSGKILLSFITLKKSGFVFNKKKH